MADTDGLQAHQHFTRAGLGDGDVLDRQRLVGLAHHGSFHGLVSSGVLLFFSVAQGGAFGQIDAAAGSYPARARIAARVGSSAGKRSSRRMSRTVTSSLVPKWATVERKLSCPAGVLTSRGTSGRRGAPPGRG